MNKYEKTYHNFQLKYFQLQNNLLNCKFDRLDLKTNIKMLEFALEDIEKRIEEDADIIKELGGVNLEIERYEKSFQKDAKNCVKIGILAAIIVTLVALTKQAPIVTQLIVPALTFVSIAGLGIGVDYLQYKSKTKAHKEYKQKHIYADIKDEQMRLINKRNKKKQKIEEKELKLQQTNAKIAELQYYIANLRDCKEKILTAEANANIALGENANTKDYNKLFGKDQKVSSVLRRSRKKYKGDK